MITKIIINRLDRKYRELEKLGNQYDVFRFVSGFLNDKELVTCLRFAQQRREQEKLELKGGK